MRLWAIALLLSGCARPPPPPSAPKPDLRLTQARVRAWDETGLRLDARAPELLVSKGAGTLEAHDARLSLPRSGAQVRAPVLAGNLAGDQFEAPRGATLDTASGLHGTAPFARYRRVADAGVFSGEHGVTLEQSDAGFSLSAAAFELDEQSQRARFEQVQTTVGAKR